MSGCCSTGPVWKQSTHHVEGGGKEKSGTDVANENMRRQSKRGKKVLSTFPGNDRGDA